MGVLNLFSKKPSLEPEVIELAPPREDSALSSIEEQPRGESVEDNVTESVPEDQNEGVFDTHIAVLYDKYLNFKEKVSNKIRDKIMDFMQHDLQNAANNDDLDEEGGLTPREPDPTYDGLIFILTIILGFVMRLPLMWILGSLLFLIYGNFKRKILKWGIINIVLSILSIAYAVKMWDFVDPQVFNVVRARRSILLSKVRHIKGVPGILNYEGKEALIITIHGDPNFNWTIVHNDSEHNMKNGSFSDDLLVNSKLIPDGTDMIRLSHEIELKGLLQMSVKFSTNNPTPHDHIKKPNSHHYPLHHKPRSKPYDLSFECHPVEEDNPNVDAHDRSSGYDDEDSPDEHEYSLVKRVGKKYLNRKRKRNIHINYDDDDYSGVNIAYVNNQAGPQGIANKDETNQTPVEHKEHKPKDHKRYIGVDAVDNDALVTRMFYVPKLSKCSLINVPKKGTDVVSVFIKRLQ
ncbi:putative integral membrane protein [Theileria parva strain Muguga]|uniref:putative integral membrane protein n=1 Tax=Theileria parva strain Muguga TaxID=333668 RepID=UPI001C620628|nr:putative integral membrane protein [Theileria parva strain Muguga]EAN31195.2 putative integral membrane protein [Theileria parva strain Muguga]